MAVCALISSGAIPAEGDPELNVAGPLSQESSSTPSLLDAVIDELQTNAPDVNRLFMTLGATSRNVQSKDDGII